MNWLRKLGLFDRRQRNEGQEFRRSGDLDDRALELTRQAQAELESLEQDITIRLAKAGSSVKGNT